MPSCHDGGSGSSNKRETTLDFIYEHTKEAPNSQTKDSEQLDVKLTAVLASATVAIGFGSRLSTPDEPSMPGVVAEWIDLSTPDLCFYLASLCWAIVVVTTAWSLVTKRYRRSYQADVLWNQHRDKDQYRVKQLVVKDIASAYAHNREVLSGKAKAVTITVLATALEGLFLALVLIFSG